MIKKNQEVKVEHESSFIEMTSYHYRLHRLSVVIRKGKHSTINNQLSTKYVFFNVPEQVYHKLLESGSSGTYFNRNIRNHYNYEKQ
jgi:hypothetical protein